MSLSFAGWKPTLGGPYVVGIVTRGLKRLSVHGLWPMNL